MKRFTWFMLSLVLFAGSAYFWRLGNQRNAEKNARPELQSPSETPSGFDTNAGLQGKQASSAASPQRPDQTVAVRVPPDPAFPFRLRNTTNSIQSLLRVDHALLLRNVLVDTTLPSNLRIPPHLRAQQPPGTYVVQSKGSISAAFREMIEARGGKIISYIPNNAYLVRVTGEAARELQGWPGTQMVLPWEPYYKIDPQLLPSAVRQDPLPEKTLLNVLGFPGERDLVVQLLEQRKLDVLGEERGPFGPVLTVQPAAGDLVALAQSPLVQGIELHRPRQPANDLTRVRLGVAANTVTEADYLGLTGTNVLVNVNDTGIDATHPDLAGRVTALFPSALTDLEGHGTHVAGIVASSGKNDSGVRAEGSVTNADFRGMAPQAKIFSMLIDLLTGPLISNDFLQQHAALTNAFISNNSWSYPGINEYNLAAASYDAAVRDSLPGAPGSQPVLYVFAAGNSGFGGDNGLGGIPGSIESPATAKNVITVGALDSPRFITNTVVIDDMTNQVFLGETDSADQVAPYSSRGNVGVGLEGLFGRFKPDVVAPGSFLVSTRSTQMTGNEILSQNIVNVIQNQLMNAGTTNFYNVFVPNNGYRLRVRIAPNLNSPDPLPVFLIHARLDEPPTSGDLISSSNVAVIPLIPPIQPGEWSYSIANTNTFDVNVDVQTIVTVTNNPGTFFAELQKLNGALGQNYRYESGTSMAAPAVSGVLALMQEFFEQRLGVTNSPALMKALLINGARSAGTSYDLQVDSVVNHQGWGLINISNSIPAELDANRMVQTDWPIRFFDQSPSNALATGESKTRVVTIDPAAQNTPLRFTLVWTDPPGNPAASVKLVNDLDLIVTNLDTGEVFLGNQFPAGSDFTVAVSSNVITGSLSLPPGDSVNNVENVFVNRPVSQRYSVTVNARRVNVNAVPQHPEGIVQDYALVISSDNPGTAAPLTVTDVPKNANPAPLFTPLVSATGSDVLLFSERVGASSPLIVSTNGATNQWNFYAFTNTTSFTNVAIATFLPPNLSRPRNQEADIDLYVSTNAVLTNLNQAVLAGARREVGRGGTAAIVYTNSNAGQVYYVGVKSEDQQAAAFGLFATASQNPFSQRDSEGNLIVRGVPAPANIPDGTPDSPKAALLFGFALEPVPIQNVVVTNVITHESGGDLLGLLAHNNESVVLNNHRSSMGTVQYIYDDSDRGSIVGADVSNPVDGPGSLRDFVGAEGQGVWMLTMIDDSPFHTGRVDQLSFKLEPRKLTNGNEVVVQELLPNRFFFTFFDVPADATALTVSLANNTDPLELYVRRESFPDRDNYDKFALIPAGGGSLTLTTGDSPPLSPGRYYIGVFNPNGTAVRNFRIVFDLAIDVRGSSIVTYAENEPVEIPDDAITNSVIHVVNNQRLSAVQVGVRIDRARASDLVLHLVSPGGTHVLLAENRGRQSTGGYGAGLGTNLIYTGFTEDTNLALLPIKFGTAPFTNNPSGRTVFSSGFETAAATDYAIGQTLEGWRVLTNQVSVVEDCKPFVRRNHFLALSSGTLSGCFRPSPGRAYNLSVAYRGPGIISWWPGTE